MVSNTGNCPYCTRDIDGSVQLETISLDGIEGLKVVVDAQDGVLSIGIITEQNTKARELFHKHSVAFKTDAKFCPYCGKQLIRTDASDKSYDYIIDDIEDDFSDDGSDSQTCEEEDIDGVGGDFDVIEDIEDIDGFDTTGSDTDSDDIDNFDDIDYTDDTSYADDIDTFVDDDTGIDDGIYSEFIPESDEDDSGDIDDFDDSNTKHTAVANMPTHFDVDSAVDEALFMMGINPYEDYGVDVVIGDDI